jgi:citrate lyase gamma subunit
MRASSSRAVASFSKVENQTLVFIGAVSVRVHDKGNLGDEPRAEVIADLLRAAAARSA